MLTFNFGFMENNMTFALKDFSDLTLHLNDCVKFVLGRLDTDKMKDVPNPRREQIQFLAAVHAELKAQIKAARIEDAPANKRMALLRPYTTIFYGAMCVINKDIANNLGSVRSGSKVMERLLVAMGISEITQPTPAQYLAFYAHFNKFLSNIYLEHDSSVGLNKNSIFQDITLDKLTKFAKLSYKLEEEAQNTVNAQLCVQGMSKVEPIRVSKDVPPGITAQFKTWEHIKESLHDLIVKEEVDKNKSSILKLDKSRSIQLQFLQAIAESLSNIKTAGFKDSDRIAILAGAMYIVRGQIAKEYSKEPLSNDDIVPTMLQYGSVVHTTLTAMLHAKEESFEHIEFMISATNQYMRYMGIEMSEGLKDSREAIRTKNIFSEIKGFDLVSVLNLNQEMIRSCRVGILERNVAEFKKDITTGKHKSSNPSYLSSFGGWFSSKPTAKASDSDSEEDDSYDEVKREVFSK
jgi:hypothetical protein